MSDLNARVHLVVLAGGQGVRVGGEVPKQFRSTGRGPLFSVAIHSFLQLSPRVGQVASLVVTVGQSWRDLAGRTLSGLSVPLSFADPGQTRTASTWSALQVLARLQPEPGDLVAVHDAARPFATPDLLERLVRAAAGAGGAVPAVPVADTVVQRDGQGRAVYLERERLAGVQTPQVFRWDLLREAHAWAAGEGRDFTDDGGLLAARGHIPSLVEGEADNWKVTTASDWERARDLLG